VGSSARRQVVALELGADVYGFDMPCIYIASFRSLSPSFPNPGIRERSHESPWSILSRILTCVFGSDRCAESREGAHHDRRRFLQFSLLRHQSTKVVGSLRSCSSRPLSGSPSRPRTPSSACRKSSGDGSKCKACSYPEKASGFRSGRSSPLEPRRCAGSTAFRPSLSPRSREVAA